MRRARFFWILLLLTSACGQPATSAGRSDPVVLATTSILADIVRNVAGDRAEVASLLPIGADPHSYQLTPQDIAKISESDLIILNGAGYERFLEPVLEAQGAGEEEMIVEASAGSRLRGDAQGEHGIDPHLWLDPNNVIAYVENIREGLTHFDPEGAAEFQANAKAYTGELIGLNVWIEEQVNWHVSFLCW